MARGYGTLPSGAGLEPRSPRRAAAGGVFALAGVALVGMVLLSARMPTVLEAPTGSQLTTTFSGETVAVPATYVDFAKGTTFSPQGLFENSAEDKDARLQQLSNGDAKDDREQVDKTAPHETKYIGTIPVDETVDAMERPLGDVKHLHCSGRDDDPECQTSAAPLFDKDHSPQQLSAQKADADLDRYFARQQKEAMEARKAITPKMQGTERLVDKAGTKFGLSARAARRQADAIFGSPKQAKAPTAQQLKLDTEDADQQVSQIFDDIAKGVHGASNGKLMDANKAVEKKYYDSEEKLLTPDMKSVKTQQLRINHGKASKIPAHLTTFPTQSANADVANFFDHMPASNNGHLYDHEKKKPQFKVSHAQQLAAKYQHHGYSTQMANADLMHFYSSMPAKNNHHLQDKHADRYNDPHTAWLKGHEAAAPKKHGARKAGMQMLRNNRDDAFLGDNSPQTAPGTLVKYAAQEAKGDLDSFYNGLKKTRYGANNGHLKDRTPQPNRAKGQYHGETAAKAMADVNGYFASMQQPKRTQSSAAKRAGLDTDAAMHDINGYFKATAPKVKHAAAKLDPKLDATAADEDVEGFFKSLAKGEHGANNGHLRAKNAHASGRKGAREAGNKKVTAQEARDEINEYYGDALATAPQEQPNMKPGTESIGDVTMQKPLDAPLWEGYKHKTGMQHPDAHELDDKQVDVTDADCGDNKDCSSSRSPLLYKGKKGDGSLKAGADGMSAAKADQDLATYFKKEDKATKAEAASEEKRAAKVGLSSKAARKDAKAYYKQEDKATKTEEAAEEKAASKVGLSAKAARKDAKTYFTEEQKLAEYGVGPEDDHKIVVNQAMGVDAMMPESMFESNPEPSGDTLDEVNEAIQAQRNEGYTNGDGAPADDLEVP